MSELSPYTTTSALRDYRLRVWSYCEDLQRETDPVIRANTALYLAEAATALARLEMAEAHNVTTAPLPSSHQ